MARTDSPQQIAIEVNGKNLFMQKVAFTVTAGVTTFATASTTAAGAVPVGAGAKLMLQADTAFFYQTLPAGAATSVTILSGGQPGTYVAALAKEYVFLAPGDTQLDIVRATADGMVAVFLVL